jgi:hypothetical protein
VAQQQTQAAPTMRGTRNEDTRNGRGGYEE